MNKLITDKELDDLECYLINTLPSCLTIITDKEWNIAFNNYHKLLSSYQYYKNRVAELELEIDDILNRDFDL